MTPTAIAYSSIKLPSEFVAATHVEGAAAVAGVPLSQPLQLESIQMTVYVIRRLVQGFVVLALSAVRTAWAKDLSQRVIILKHALRKALILVITIVTLGLPGLFSGAIATETVFGYSGMEQLFVQAVFQVDLPLVMTFLLIVTTLMILCNILADILYAVADPQIRLS